jgi:hypothetical protein
VFLTNRDRCEYEPNNNFIAVGHIATEKFNLPGKYWHMKQLVQLLGLHLLH